MAVLGLHGGAEGGRVNFYKHYIGDFQRDTGHLSLTERGAYLCLIHHYYATEKPLPNDLVALCRVAGAQTKAERDAVKTAMGFFELVESGLMHARIEAELQKAGHVSSTNRDIALAREARRKQERTEHEQSTIRAPNVPRTEHEQSTHQTPDTRHHKDNTGSDDPALSLGTVRDPVGQPFEPTPAATVCMALKAAGIGKVSPQNQRLLMLLAAGAQVGEFVGFVGKALETAPGAAFEYVLGAVEGERKRALATAHRLHKGPMPAHETPRQAAAIERAIELSGGMLNARKTPRQEYIDADTGHLPALG